MKKNILKIVSSRFIKGFIITTLATLLICVEAYAIPINIISQKYVVKGEGYHQGDYHSYEITSHQPLSHSINEWEYNDEAERYDILIIDTIASGGNNDSEAWVNVWTWMYQEVDAQPIYAYADSMMQFQPLYSGSGVVSIDVSLYTDPSFLHASLFDETISEFVIQHDPIAFMGDYPEQVSKQIFLDSSHIYTMRTWTESYEEASWYGWNPFCKISISNFDAVPEPSTMLLLCTGLIGLAGVFRNQVSDKKGNKK
jgi:hypothetical protein